jgi:hypothetical protein
LDLILEYDVARFFLYSIINIDLNVPCYFALIEEMKNDYPIDKTYDKKDSYLFHICMLKPNKDHMNVIHVHMMNQQNLIKMFPLL